MTPEQIREACDAKIKKIRAREDLTDQAKQVAMARAHQDAAARINNAYQADRQQYDSRRTTLEKRLFGNKEVQGMDALSARDARERAARYGSPDDALQAYQRAQRDGDRDMMRALVSHAADNATVPLFGAAWSPILDAHAASSPGYEANYQELQELREPGGVGDPTYMPPAPPSELGRLSPQQISSLANSDLAVHSTDAPEAA